MSDYSAVLTVGDAIPSAGTPASPDLAALWATMDITSPATVAQIAHRIASGQSRYQTVVDVLVAKGGNIPWQFIGLVHWMECNLSWNHHLYNGDPLTARTIHYPPGRPIAGAPPFTWEFSAEAALTDQGMTGHKDWSIPGMLDTLERYNGLGYRKVGIYSPYLWSFSSNYTSGKFIEILKDTSNPSLGYHSVFSSITISQEVGAAPLLKYLSDPSLGVVTQGL
jgi:lysozyme family protein